MDDTFQTDKRLSADSIYPAALELGALLRDYRGGNVLVMDLRELDGWTDFFVIATVTSSTHLQGLEQHIREFSKQKDIPILRSSLQPRPLPGYRAAEEWRIIDLGVMAVHLMTAQTRAFYELERLWSAAPIIFQEEPPE
ncbi:MAG: ribosome silencing factor [Spirochaetaceae bacterium]|jgi:ribosome-associated protein|nr:ribosome silencing factor [Spirochaetaceae bacterium]